MPIYEYECVQCKHHFEYLKLSSSPEAVCPACHATKLKQLISLSSMSSDGSRQASLSAAHRKMAKVRKGKARDEHQDLHEHFHDPKTGGAS